MSLSSWIQHIMHIFIDLTGSFFPTFLVIWVNCLARECSPLAWTVEDYFYYSWI